MDPAVAEYEGRYQQVVDTLGSTIVRKFAKLQINLGHPSAQASSAACKASSLDQPYVDCALQFMSERCLRGAAPAPSRPAQLPKAKRFNEVVLCDVFHIVWKVDRFRMENQCKLIPEKLLYEQTLSDLFDLSSLDSDYESSCESGEPENLIEIVKETLKEKNQFYLNVLN